MEVIEALPLDRLGVTAVDWGLRIWRCGERGLMRGGEWSEIKEGARGIGVC